MASDFGVMDNIKWGLARVQDQQLLQWAGILIVAGAVLGDGVTVLNRSLGLAFAPLFALRILALLVTILVGAYAVPRLTMRAMAICQIPTMAQPPDIPRWIVFYVRNLFVNAFCWYDKKLLIPAVILLIVGLVAGVASLGKLADVLGRVAVQNMSDSDKLSLVFSLLGTLLLLMLAFGAWAIAMVIFSYRTIFAFIIMLRGEGTDETAIRRAYDLVVGKTAAVFWTFFKAGFILLLAMIPVIIVTGILTVIPVAGSALAYLLTLAVSLVIGIVSALFVCRYYLYFTGSLADGRKV